MKLRARRLSRRFFVNLNAFESDVITDTAEVYFWWWSVMTILIAAGALASAAQVWEYPYPRALFLAVSSYSVVVSILVAFVYATHRLRIMARAKAAQRNRRLHHWWRYIRYLHLAVAVIMVVPSIGIAHGTAALLQCRNASMTNLCNIPQSDMDRDKATEIDTKLNQVFGLP